MEPKINKKLVWFLLVFIVSLVVSATKPSFVDPSIDGYTFNISQGDYFVDYITATDGESEYPLNFTDDSQDSDVNFTVFYMENYNDTSAKMNFTPTNADVGIYNNLHVIAQDIAEETQVILIKFNISNVNDAPNITEYYTTSLTPTIAENSSTPLYFNYTATDPDSPYGDVLGDRWFVDSVIMAENSSTYNYTPQFCDSGTRNLTLIVYDTSESIDYIEWAVDVTNTNRPPKFNLSNVVMNVSWQEDTNLTENITLSNHFYDLDTLECNGSNSDTLVYSTYSNINVTVAINQTTSNVSLYPDYNWAGNETVIFSINDGTKGNASNIVILSVNNTNDFPDLETINQIDWAIGINYTSQLNVSDPDLVYGDSLIFSFVDVNDTFSEFNMNSSGFINFTAWTVGVHWMNISVNDSYNETDYEWLIFNATTNYAPVLDLINNQSVIENIFFNLTVTASDQNSDNLTFTTNYTGFSVDYLNSTAVALYFTPDNDDVGNHTINVTVMDKYNKQDSQVFVLTVIDENTAPVLNPIGSQIAKINKTFLLYVNATDADGDNMTFTDNSTKFNITTIDSTTAQGLINFTPSESDLGNYSIMINVSDWNLTDYEIVNFTITYNRAPSIENISNQTAVTGSLFSINVTGSDLDGDTLNFSTNYSNIQVRGINSTTSELYFIPRVGDLGLHIINVTIDDNDNLNTSTTFYLNITYGNNTPYFENITNKWCVLGLDCRFNITSYDIDGEVLDVTTLPDIFTTIIVNTTINSTTAQLNFTPTNSSISNYTINITIDDGNTSNTTSFLIIINNAPIIDSYTPLGLTPIVEENSSLQFNHTSHDPENHSINYTWRLGRWDNYSINLCECFDSTDQDICENNGYASCVWRTPECEPENWYSWWQTKSNNESWLFEANWTSAGNHTVAIIVTDFYGAKTNTTWNMIVTNKNREPVFGKKIHSTYDDFSSGTFNQSNLTSNGIIMLETNNPYYYGTFISSSMDFSFSYIETNITTAELTTIEPTNTSISLDTRTSSLGTNWGSWLSHNLSENITEGLYNQYFQYNITLNTTNTSITPNVSRVEINYIITNKTWNENTVLLNWIDLDDFFYDLDTDDTLTFTTTGNNQTVVEINSETHRVNLRPTANFIGSETMYFTLTDGEYSVISNNITLTTIEVESELGTSAGAGGGGSASTISQTEEIEVNESVLTSFDLISPLEPTTYANGSVMTPILIQNLGNETLEEITLSASSDNKDLNLSLSIYFIEKLEIDEKVETILLITPGRSYDSYEVVVKASVKAPKFGDSAKIFISSLMKGEHNETQINTKITFMEDLLVSNPECLELNEALESAKTLLSEGRYEESNKIIDSVIESCKYLLSAGGGIIEKLSERGIFSKLKKLMKTKEFYISAAFLGISLISLIIYFVYDSIKKK
ncbi:hypothetical protein HQ529_01595 [Candidatus Woesearchaeota archaeon]|nr:hypothetical protein [Candidatus Woesearchaeota archaeon]